jgi:hypothetical protein
VPIRGPADTYFSPAIAYSRVNGRRSPVRRPSAVCSLVRQAAGLLFWFKRNRFVGS